MKQTPYLFNLNELSLTQKHKDLPSINSIRFQRHRQQQKQRQIQNRVKYLLLEKQKDMKAADWVKRKHQQIVQVRDQSHKQKCSLRQKKIILESQNKGYIHYMKNKNIKEKLEAEEKVKQWRKNHMEKAIPVKQLHRQHSKQIIQYRNNQYHKNKSVVKQVRHQQKEKMLKFKSLELTRRLFARMNHNNKVLQELNRKQTQTDRNDQLYRKLLRTSQETHRTSLQARDSVSNYEQAMNITIKSGRLRKSVQKDSLWLQ